jgi:PIN domain nuclease of toxin-antitoxin system
MITQIVLDASSVIALINREKGCEIVEKYLDEAIISTVNFAEVIAVVNRELFKTEADRAEGLKLITDTLPQIIDFDVNQAIMSASFDAITRKYGLSLGDRACLALAKYKNIPVLTADKAWSKLNLGIKIKLIRS